MSRIKTPVTCKCKFPTGLIITFFLIFVKVKVKNNTIWNVANARVLHLATQNARRKQVNGFNRKRCS